MLHCITHINLRYHAIRDHASDLCFCPGSKNLADPLYKALPSNKYFAMFNPFANAENEQERTYDDDAYAFTSSCFYVSWLRESSSTGGGNVNSVNSTRKNHLYNVHSIIACEKWKTEIERTKHEKWENMKMERVNSKVENHNNTEQWTKKNMKYWTMQALETNTTKNEKS